MPSSVDADEVAHNELSHLYLYTTFDETFWEILQTQTLK